MFPPDFHPILKEAFRPKRHAAHLGENGGMGAPAHNPKKAIGQNLGAVNK